MANIAAPAIHQGRFRPVTSDAAAAARCPVDPSTLAPHWLQNAAAGAAFAPHWLQNRPPSFAPQCWQKFPVAGRPQSGQ
jgi:hypothetical protein